MFVLDSLQSFVNDITGTVNVDVILAMMVQENLLTLNQAQDLGNLYHTPVTKQQRLCSIITGLPEDCVDRFIHCLHETSDYEPHRTLHDKLYEFRQGTE